MPILECLEFAWETFKRHASALVIIALVLGVVQAVLNGVLTWSLGRVGPFASILASGLPWGGMMLAARKAARGETPTLNDAFIPFNARQGEYLIVGLAANIGVLMCGIGVLISACLCLFAPLAVVDGAEWKPALLRSKDLVLRDPAAIALFFATLIALNVAGFIVFGLGLLVSVPVSALAIVKAHELASTRFALPPNPAEPV
jgi:uncharacterized membrane protein